MKGKKGKMIRRVGIFMLVSSMVFSGAACSLLPVEEELPTSPATSSGNKFGYKTVPVKSGQLLNEITVSVSYQPSTEEKLYFALDGEKIAEVYVKQGDTIHKGQLIAELEMGSILSQIESQEDKIRDMELQITHERESLQLTQNQNATRLKIAQEKLQNAQKALEEGEDLLKKWEEQQAASSENEESSSELESSSLEAENEESSSEPEGSSLEAEDSQQSSDPETVSPAAPAVDLDALQKAVDQAKLEVETLSSQAGSSETSLKNGLASLNDSLAVQKEKMQELEEKKKLRQVYASIEGTVQSVLDIDDNPVSSTNLAVAVVQDYSTSVFVLEGASASTYFTEGEAVEITIKDQNYAAKVLRITKGEKVRTYFSLDVPNPALGKSTTGRIKKVLEQKSDILFVPIKALHTSGEDVYVFVMDENSLRTRRTVTLGMETGDSIEIISGLKEGELVILE